MVKNFRIVVHGEKAPKGEVYVSGENPRGELGFYIYSTGNHCGRHSPLGKFGPRGGRNRQVGGTK
jgi:hypothetical protein